MLWRPTVVYPERVPPTGGCILAASHRSSLDTSLLAYVTKRRIRFMGKAELWRVAGVGLVFSALGAFPVDRHIVDRTALETALAVLGSGEALGVFPEGTRRSGPTVEHLHNGVAYLALRASVPVIPVGIGGSQQILPKGRKLPKRGRIVIVLGEPVYPRTGALSGSRPHLRRENVDAMTADITRSLQAAFQEAEELLARRPGRSGLPSHAQTRD